jgi:hypothetical protein
LARAIILMQARLASRPQFNDNPSGGIVYIPLGRDPEETTSTDQIISLGLTRETASGAQLRVNSIH